MSEGNGKVVGGAALGAGGVLAAVLKLCSAESHVATGAVQAARGAGEVGIVARGAGELGAVGRSAGEIGALGHAGEIGAATRGAGTLGHGAGAVIMGERGAERIMLAGLGAPIEVRALSPVSLRVAEDGARVGAARGLAPAVARTGAKVPAATAAAKAARSAKLKDALAHALDAKDVLDVAMNAWDFSEPLGDDDDADLERRFSSMGMSFHDDVVPSMRGEPVAGIAGAQREMLSDGRRLVPAARLAPRTPSSRVGEEDKLAITHQAGTSAPIATIYLEVPSDEQVTRAPKLLTKLLLASLSPAIDWDELTTSGPVVLPAVLEDGTHRFVRIATGGTRVVLLRGRPIAGR